MKIEFISRMQVNYVFHILSVARCGYDNEYGRKYREMYDEMDLQIIKKYEDELTVKGGEHAGKLIWIPAGLAMLYDDIGDFIQESIQQIEQDDFNIPVYDKSQKNTVLDILNVYQKNYPRYKNEIWPEEKNILDKYIRDFERKFSETNFTERAENLIGIQSEESFVVSFVLSISGGAEAIFIGSQEDVFSVQDDIDSKMKFIGHEYIIYLLEKALPPMENWWLDKKIYNAREALADFYLQSILGPSNYFNEMQSYVDFYKEKSGEGKYSPAELLELALKRG